MTEGAHLLLGASLALSLAIVIIAWRDPEIDPVLRLAVVAMAAAGALHALLVGPPGRLLPPPWPLLARIPAALGLVALWVTVRLLFEPGFQPRQARGQVLALLAALVLALLSGLAGPTGQKVMTVAVLLVAAGLIAHLLWLLVAGHADDLDDLRRRLRLLLAGGGSAYVVLALWAYASGWRAARPEASGLVLAAAQLAFKLAWLVLVLGRPSPMLRLFRITHDPPPATLARPVVDAVAEARSGVGQAQGARLAAELLEAMQVQRLYRQTGLGIGELARRLGQPEHRIRAAINGHLGFRNYAAFLNHFRLREIAARLQAPEDAHLPILTLALDAGYASLGPFNRAFRDAYGCTPSEFRTVPRASPPPD